VRAPVRLASRIAVLCVAAALALCAGCAGLKPWERVKLADYLMRPDRDPLRGSLADHVYFTREAAAGGGSVGGGGCGCN
jgi:hypothetical protein